MRFPRLVAPLAASTAVTVAVEAGGIDADGAPVEGASWSGAVNWQDVSSRAFLPNREEASVSARLYADGDILPEVAFIEGGTVAAFGESRRIVKGSKARNPDGTVNYTRLDLE